MLRNIAYLRFFVRLTKSPGAIFNSEAGPKGEGQESVVTRTYNKFILFNGIGTDVYFWQCLQ